MPNEPEKSIEPALHAYAQKRRDDAGAPLDLHPATRQLLQGEVARTLVKPAGEAPSRFQWLRTAWPRLAFGGAIFATLIFVVVLMQSGQRVGPGGSMMQLAKQTAKPAAVEKEAQDRDETAPMSAASALAPSPPQAMGGAPLDSINEAKKDSYARSSPVTAPTPTTTRTLKPTETATQSREEMVRQDFSFQVKSETAEAKAGGTPAAEKSLTEARRQLGATLEQPAKPTDKIEPPAQPQLRMMRAAGQSRPAIADEKKAAKQLAPAVAAADAVAESGKLMKLAERDAKQGTDKPAAMLAVTPLPAFSQATPANRLAIDAAQAASNIVYFYTSGGDLRLSFSQGDARAKYRQNLNSPPVPDVLTSFQIERTGNAIRIIDADGSTYAGQIIPANASDSLAYAKDESARLSDAAKKESRENSLAKNLAQRGAPALAVRAENSPAAGFSFHAVGTNQTLNQSVEFFGTMVLDAATTPADVTTGLAVVKAKAAAPTRSIAPTTKRLVTPAPASGPPTNVVPQQAEIPRGKIQGKAVVGGKNQFEVIAVPTTK